MIRKRQDSHLQLPRVTVRQQHNIMIVYVSPTDEPTSRGYYFLADILS